MCVTIMAYTTQGKFVANMPQIVFMAPEALRQSVTVNMAWEVHVVELGGVVGGVAVIAVAACVVPHWLVAIAVPIVIQTVPSTVTFIWSFVSSISHGHLESRLLPHVPLHSIHLLGLCVLPMLHLAPGWSSDHHVHANKSH